MLIDFERLRLLSIDYYKNYREYSSDYTGFASIKIKSTKCNHGEKLIGSN
jgi:hypothetical protein